jgi:hypothetical protein
VRLPALIVLVAWLAACAGPDTDLPTIASGEIAAERKRQLSHQLQTYAAQTARLAHVAHRIMVANAEFCRAQVAPLAGFVAVTYREVPERMRTTARTVLNLDDSGATVISVVDGGPAARAGLKVGDVIRTLNGEIVPGGEVDSTWLSERLTRWGRQTARVGVERQGKPLTIAVVPDMGCAHPVVLAMDGKADAFTDGRRIVVHGGVLRIAQTDAELAAVVAHELAHITMAHIEKKITNQVTGAIGGALVDLALAAARIDTGGAFTRELSSAGLQAYSVEFEKEADYVGAYYAARAGFDLSEAERFWRAMAQENPRQILFAGSHPTSPERFLLMQRTREEIQWKRLRRQALRPETKAPPATSVSALTSDR